MLINDRKIPIHEVLKKAKAQADIDPNEAIAILMGVSQRASFAPWGSHALIRLLIKEGRKEESRRYCTKLFNTHPEFAAGWQPRLDCSTTVWPLSMTCLTASSLNSAVYFVLFISSTPIQF
jgi:hypothetical protein